MSYFYRGVALIRDETNGFFSTFVARHRNPDRGRQLAMKERLGT